SDSDMERAESLSGLIMALEDLPNGKTIEYHQVYREMIDIFPILVSELVRIRDICRQKDMLMVNKGKKKMGFLLSRKGRKIAKR
ncbi:MAG: hypothetical protein PHU71_07140, partial [Candidatus Gracilibacteria bacterium]|nr:hypothetical protein [Candidatus Gracilibacteria bacterium]